MLFEAGAQFVKRGSHALAFGIDRVEHCAQLDAPLILLDEQHEYGIAGCIRDSREIVQAIIEHAYYRSRQRSIDLHERRAFDADRAQIGRRFVEHKLQSLAIEFGVAFLGKNERALALAVGDEQLDLNEHLTATRNGIWVIGVGKAIEQHLDAARFTFEGLLDFDEQLALAVQSPHLALHLGLALKHGIAAPQALLRCSKRLAALIDCRDVFGKTARPPLTG